MTQRGSNLLMATATCTATLALALVTAGCGESSKSASNPGTSGGQGSGGGGGATSGGSASGGSLVLDPNGGSNTSGGKSCVDSQGHEPGSFDRSFGTDGTVHLDAEVRAGGASNLLFRLIEGDDGALFALADSGLGCAVFKLDRDGKPAGGFGTNGRASLAFETTGFCLALTRDAEGRLLVSGSDLFDAFVARFTAEGALDTTFGTDGRTTIDFGSNNDRIVDLIVMDDGSLAAVGSGNSNATIVDDYAIFFSAQGAVLGDKAVPLEVGEGRQYPVTLQQLSDGKLLILGANQTLSSAYQVKVNAAGAIETGYADMGWLRTKDKSFDGMLGFIASKDGPTAWGYAPGNRVARIDAVGNYKAVGMDNSVFPQAVAEQCDGKVLVAGVNRDNGAALMRLLPEGTSDGSFPQVSWPKVEAKPSQAKQVWLQADGRVVVAGNDGDQLFVARFWP